MLVPSKGFLPTVRAKPSGLRRCSPALPSLLSPSLIPLKRLRGQQTPATPGDKETLDSGVAQNCFNLLGLAVVFFGPALVLLSGQKFEFHDWTRRLNLSEVQETLVRGASHRYRGGRDAAEVVQTQDATIISKDPEPQSPNRSRQSRAVRALLRSVWWMTWTTLEMPVRALDLVALPDAISVSKNGKASDTSKDSHTADADTVVTLPTSMEGDTERQIAPQALKAAGLKALSDKDIGEGMQDCHASGDPQGLQGTPLDALLEFKLPEDVISRYGTAILGAVATMLVLPLLLAHLVGKSTEPRPRSTQEARLSSPSEPGPHKPTGSVYEKSHVLKKRRFQHPHISPGSKHHDACVEEALKRLTQANVEQITHRLGSAKTGSDGDAAALQIVADVMAARGVEGINVGNIVGVMMTMDDVAGLGSSRLETLKPATDSHYHSEGRGANEGAKAEASLTQSADRKDCLQEKLPEHMDEEEVTPLYQVVPDVPSHINTLPETSQLPVFEHGYKLALPNATHVQLDENAVLPAPDAPDSPNSREVQVPRAPLIYLQEEAQEHAPGEPLFNPNAEAPEVPDALDTQLAGALTDSQLHSLKVSGDQDADLLAKEAAPKGLHQPVEEPAAVSLWERFQQEYGHDEPEGASCKQVDAEAVEPEVISVWEKAQQDGETVEAEESAAAALDALWGKAQQDGETVEAEESAAVALDGLWEKAQQYDETVEAEETTAEATDSIREKAQQDVETFEAEDGAAAGMDAIWEKVQQDGGADAAPHEMPATEAVAGSLDGADIIMLQDLVDAGVAADRMDMCQEQLPDCMSELEEGFNNEDEDEVPVPSYMQDLKAAVRDAGREQEPDLEEGRQETTAQIRDEIGQSEASLVVAELEVPVLDTDELQALVLTVPLCHVGVQVPDMLSEDSNKALDLDVGENEEPFFPSSASDADQAAAVDEAKIELLSESHHDAIVALPPAPPMLSLPAPRCEAAFELVEDEETRTADKSRADEETNSVVEVGKGAKEGRSAVRVFISPHADVYREVSASSIPAVEDSTLHESPFPTDEEVTPLVMHGPAYIVDPAREPEEEIIQADAPHDADTSTWIARADPTGPRALPGGDQDIIIIKCLGPEEVSGPLVLSLQDCVDMRLLAGSPAPQMLPSSSEDLSTLCGQVLKYAGGASSASELQEHAAEGVEQHAGQDDKVVMTDIDRCLVDLAWDAEMEGKMADYYQLGNMADYYHPDTLNDSKPALDDAKPIMEAAASDLEQWVADLEWEAELEKDLFCSLGVAKRRGLEKGPELRDVWKNAFASGQEAVANQEGQLQHQNELLVQKAEMERRAAELDAREHAAKQRELQLLDELASQQELALQELKLKHREQALHEEEVVREAELESRKKDLRKAEWEHRMKVYAFEQQLLWHRKAEKEVQEAFAVLNAQRVELEQQVEAHQVMVAEQESVVKDMESELREKEMALQQEQNELGEWCAQVLDLQKAVEGKENYVMQMELDLSQKSGEVEQKLLDIREQMLHVNNSWAEIHSCQAELEEQKAELAETAAGFALKELQLKEALEAVDSQIDARRCRLDEREAALAEKAARFAEMEHELEGAFAQRVEEYHSEIARMRRESYEALDKKNEEIREVIARMEAEKAEANREAAKKLEKERSKHARQMDKYYQSLEEAVEARAAHEAELRQLAEALEQKEQSYSADLIAKQEELRAAHDLVINQTERSDNLEHQVTELQAALKSAADSAAEMKAELVKVVAFKEAELLERERKWHKEESMEAASLSVDPQQASAPPASADEDSSFEEGSFEEELSDTELEIEKWERALESKLPAAHRSASQRISRSSLKPRRLTTKQQKQQQRKEKRQRQKQLCKLKRTGKSGLAHEQPALAEWREKEAAVAAQAASARTEDKSLLILYPALSETQQAESQHELVELQHDIDTPQLDLEQAELLKVASNSPVVTDLPQWSSSAMVTPKGAVNSTAVAQEAEEIFAQMEKENDACAQEEVKAAAEDSEAVVTEADESTEVLAQTHREDDAWVQGEDESSCVKTAAEVEVVSDLELKVDVAGEAKEVLTQMQKENDAGEQDPEHIVEQLEIENVEADAVGSVAEEDSDAVAEDAAPITTPVLEVQPMPKAEEEAEAVAVQSGVKEINTRYLRQQPLAPPNVSEHVVDVAGGLTILRTTGQMKVYEPTVLAEATLDFDKNNTLGLYFQDLQDLMNPLHAGSAESMLAVQDESPCDGAVGVSNQQDHASLNLTEGSSEESGSKVQESVLGNKEQASCSQVILGEEEAGALDLDDVVPVVLEQWGEEEELKAPQGIIEELDVAQEAEEVLAQLQKENDACEEAEEEEMESALVSSYMRASGEKVAEELEAGVKEVLAGVQSENDAWVQGADPQKVVKQLKLENDAWVQEADPQKVVKQLQLENDAWVQEADPQKVVQQLQLENEKDQVIAVTAAGPWQEDALAVAWNEEEEEEMYVPQGSIEDLGNAQVAEQVLAQLQKENDACEEEEKEVEAAAEDPEDVVTEVDEAKKVIAQMQKENDAWEQEEEEKVAEESEKVVAVAEEAEEVLAQMKEENHARELEEKEAEEALSGMQKENYTRGVMVDSANGSAPSTQEESSIVDFGFVWGDTDVSEVIVDPAALEIFSLPEHKSATLGRHSVHLLAAAVDCEVPKPEGELDALDLVCEDCPESSILSDSITSHDSPDYASHESQHKPHTFISGWPPHENDDSDDDFWDQRASS